MSTLNQLAFALLKGNNVTLAAKILNLIGSEDAFFAASTETLQYLLGGKHRMLSAEERNAALEAAESEMKFIENHNIGLLYFNAPDYPARLLECEDAPVALFRLGNTNLNAKHVVSIVGTRHATIYGVNQINRLVDDLSASIDDLLIISGMAVGCDIAAQRRAMECDIPTVGVVAHGLDTMYPSEHRTYAAQIIRSGGGLVTEYPHGTRPHRGNFLARNRIIAGMADCTVVVETAAGRGGALSTARLAMQYNREVAAFPGRVSDPYSAGCNELIHKSQAALIQGASDLIEQMGWTSRKAAPEQKELFVELTPEQKSIAEYLAQRGEATLNTMVLDLGIPVGKLMGLLVDMEFNSIVLSLPGSRYILG